MFWIAMALEFLLLAVVVVMFIHISPFSLPGTPVFILLGAGAFSIGGVIAGLAIRHSTFSYGYWSAVGLAALVGIVIGVQALRKDVYKR